MLSTDERVVVLYGVMHSIIRAFGLQQRLQNEREEEWFHLGGGRSGETSHHRDTSSSSLVRISSASMPCIRYQTTKTHQIEITYVAKRRVLLIVNHDVYPPSFRSYIIFGDLFLCGSSRSTACFTFRPNRPGRIYSVHWVRLPRKWVLTLIPWCLTMVSRQPKN